MAVIFMVIRLISEAESRSITKHIGHTKVNFYRRFVTNLSTVLGYI